MAATLLDVEGGVDALSEIDFTALCAQAGVPPPQRQGVRTDVHGRRRYRDAVWKRQDGRVVSCEIDGIGHLEAGPEVVSGVRPRVARMTTSPGGTSPVWTAPTLDRPDPPRVAGERTALEAWLEYQRNTLLTKCAGLTEDQLRQRSAPPSNLSLLGLVRHMAEVERWWFRINVGAQPLPEIYCSETNRDGDFDDVDQADVQADLATYRSEVDLARQVAAGRDLDATYERPHGPLDVRWTYLHMIEEYARHNGHADILRERIDGVTGD